MDSYKLLTGITTIMQHDIDINRIHDTQGPFRQHQNDGNFGKFRAQKGDLGWGL